MDSYLDHAGKLREQLVLHRRYFHQNAESGLQMPLTKRYVSDALTGFGLSPQSLEPYGIACVIQGARHGKTLLLRADMDALPMTELTGLSYSSRTGNAHTCGHDLHAAMLLGAAQILAEDRDNLCGNVKLVFQAGEETFEGARGLADAGVLHLPEVDAAMSLHITPDDLPGSIGYCTGFATLSSDSFKITIQGRGCASTETDSGVDPINVGAHIYLGFQELMARETPLQQPASLVFGQFSSGSTSNIVPETALLQGTLRTYDAGLRAALMARMRDIADLTARTYNASVQFEVFSSVPAIYNDPALTEEMMGYIGELDLPFLHKQSDLRVPSSEDFAFIAERVPSFFVHLGAKCEGNDYTYHHPKILFNEDVLPLGAAIYAQCAAGWLRGNT